MTIFVKSVGMQAARGGFTTMRLELMMPAEQAPAFYSQVTSGMVLTDFGVSDQPSKETNVTVTRGGRKLCLD